MGLRAKVELIKTIAEQVKKTYKKVDYLKDEIDSTKKKR